MEPFPVNPTRIEPYKQFKFRVVWDNATVWGVSRVSALQITSLMPAVPLPVNIPMSTWPGMKPLWAPLRLERGLSQDRRFEDWVSLATASGQPLAQVCKDVLIELQNEAGQAVLRYIVGQCYPMAYEALPELNANGSAYAIEVITLAHAGWRRDSSLQEPAQPA